MSYNYSEEVTVSQQFLDNYGSLDPLSNEETLALIKRVEDNKNDKQAKEKLMQHNVKFIYSKVKSFRKLGDLDDLFLSGIEGFLMSLENITTDKILEICDKKNTDANHALLYVCHNNILESLNKTVSDAEPFAVTEYQYKNIKKVRACMSKVEETYSNTISEEEKLQEVSLLTGFSDKKVKQAISSSQTSISLFTPVATSEDGNEERLFNTLEDKNSQVAFDKIWKDEMKENIKSACSRLSDCEREVLFYATGYDSHDKISITDIAKKYNKSRQWVYNNLKETYQTLRFAIEDLEAYYL